MRKRNKTKWVGLALSALLLLVLVSTFLFAVTHVHHECGGLECPVCMALRAGERLLRAFAALAALPFAAAALHAEALHARAVRCQQSESRTLVDLKTKLSN